MICILESERDPAVIERNEEGRVEWVEDGEKLSEERESWPVEEVLTKQPLVTETDRLEREKSFSPLTVKRSFVNDSSTVSSSPETERVTLSILAPSSLV